MTTTCSIARRVTTLFCLSGALLLASGSAFAQSNQSASANGLAGVWFVQVTLRDCATGAPIDSFNSLVTFHRGGTISESTAGPGFAVGQRGPGTGVWEAAGHDAYAQRMVALITFDTAANLPGRPGFNPALPISPGFFAGWSTVTHTVEMSDANHITSSGTNTFYKAGMERSIGQAVRPQPACASSKTDRPGATSIGPAAVFKPGPGSGFGTFDVRTLLVRNVRLVRRCWNPFAPPHRWNVHPEHHRTLRTLALLRRRGRQHVADRGDPPAARLPDHHEGRPHAAIAPSPPVIT